MSDLGRKTVEVVCDRCGRKKRRSVAWVLEHKSFTCAACGAEVFVDQARLMERARKLTEVVAAALSGITKRL